MTAPKKTIRKRTVKLQAVSVSVPATESSPPDLFVRVASILDQARAGVVRAVNSQMVQAYWLIGREIVQEVQGGKERAEYGRKVLEDLSLKLTERYGDGFSETTLQYFRKFYLAYANRHFPIPRPMGVELPTTNKQDEISRPLGVKLARLDIQRPMGSESLVGFSPQLNWSHYRALMRVDKPEAREFYEREAIECGWSKTQLERQIHTAYYERLIKTSGKPGMVPVRRDRLAGETLEPVQALKAPYVLEFLNLPNRPELHENDLEQAIIDNLQSFLLELGKGFSFVARQKHIRFDEDDFYVDLVFYNFVLKCFVLVDLKLGKLTHRDVGQMDGYVRLFEDRFKVAGDNPTIGLILCSDKSDAVAKYSVLKENRQLFAAKYLDFLPSEAVLQAEIARERRLIEANSSSDSHDLPE
jgi:predicted nuclease of restriction endonuclease-like (RecB) superfamily